MKIIYLIGSVIFTTVILLLAFGNTSAQCSEIHLLFYRLNLSPTVLILGVAVLGILTGVLYHAFLGKTLQNTNDENSEKF